MLDEIERTIKPRLDRFCEPSYFVLDGLVLLFGWRYQEQHVDILGDVVRIVYRDGGYLGVAEGPELTHNACVIGEATKPFDPSNRFSDVLCRRVYRKPHDY